MSASQVYLSSSELVPSAAGTGSNNVVIKGAQNSLVLLGAARVVSAAAAAGGQPLQPATQTLLFNCPGALANDVCIWAKESSATPASVVLGFTLANPGAANAQYTFTLSANEAFVVNVSLYRAV